MRRAAAVAAVAVLLLTGCGEDEPEPAEGAGDAATSPAEQGADTEAEEGAGDPPDGSTGAPSDREGSTGSTGSAGDVAVMVGSTDLGEVLTDAEGMTLYMFDPDAQGASTCYDDCATAWPPLTTTGEPSAGAGADTSLLGVVERTDGSQQVTYDGWPLYYWQGDSAAGQVDGQAVNDVWWVLGPDGQPIRE